LRVSLECLAVIVLEEIGARNNEDDINHRVEISVSDARVQNQAAQQDRQISEIVEEDIASEGPHPGT